MGTGHTLYTQSFILWIDPDVGDRFMDDISQVILSASKAPGGGYWSFPKHSGKFTHDTLLWTGIVIIYLQGVGKNLVITR